MEQFQQATIEIIILKPGLNFPFVFLWVSMKSTVIIWLNGFKESANLKGKIRYSQ